MEYQTDTRNGCSTRRYHWPVRKVKRGMQPASKRPRKNRAAINPPKLLHAAMHVQAIPHPRTNVGINIRGRTLTINQAENGCHASCAMGEIDPTREYWDPVRPVSSWRPKTDDVPRTALAITCGPLARFRQGRLLIVRTCRK